MADVGVLASMLTSEKRKIIVSNIRNDPLEFITSSKYSPETLLHCICKVIGQGDEDLANKLQLLLLLQEASAILVANNECLEEVVIALNDYFAHLKSVNNFVKGQVMVTITIILLNYRNQSENCESFRSLFTSHCEQLWYLASNVNGLDNSILREITCECLLEIEESYPGIFLSKMKDIERMSFKEMLYPFQGYACLLSVILKNACQVAQSQLARTNIMLALMKKPLLTSDSMQHVTSEIAHKSEVVSLLDMVPLMSSASASYMVLNILEMRQSDVFYFKTFIHRFMLSSDLVMFQLAHKVQRTFNASIMTSDDGDNMVRILVHKCNNLGLSVPSRLLLLNMVLEKLHDQSMAVFLKEMEINFVPLPLDVLEVHEKKLKILVQLDLAFGHQRFFEQIGKMYLQIAADEDGSLATTFFRLLYCYLNFRSDCNPDEAVLVIVQRIGRLFSKNYPLFAMHHLDFVRKIKTITVLSKFAEDVLSTSVLHITDLPVQRIGPHLEHFLTFLAEVAIEEPRQSQPKAIVNFLSKVLGQRLLLQASNTSTWLLGHLLLNVCKSLLSHHNENHLFKEFGDVLVKVMAEFGDVDVRDRAQAYYMLLTSLAPRKITAMFEPKIRGPRESIVSGIGKSSYGFAAPINHLAFPVLQLIREKKEWLVNDKEIDESDVCEDVKVRDYFTYLQEFNVCWKSVLEFKLEMVPHSSPDLEAFFGIVLTFCGPTYIGEINCVKVLHLTTKEDVTIAVELKPHRPLPSNLTVSAMFNDPEGRVCFNELSPVRLEFEDMLQPLPVPPEILVSLSADAYRRRLASLLWDEFADEGTENRYHQCVVRLIIDEDGYRNLLSAKHYLADYVTETQDSGDTSSAVVAMLVPRRSHLILRVTFRSTDNVVVQIRTDSVDVLRQINVYMLNYEENFNQLKSDRNSVTGICNL